MGKRKRNKRGSRASGPILEGREAAAHVLPTSGEVMGWFADGLQLKGYARDDRSARSDGEDDRLPSPKQAQRYFNGERIEDPADVRDIVLVMLKALIPARFWPAVGPGAENAPPLPEVIADRLLAELNDWDRLRANLSGAAFPTFDLASTIEPFVRMVALDFGLRWGAGCARRKIIFGRDMNPRPFWAEADALRVVMDKFRGEAVSLDDLACQLGETPGARGIRKRLDDWRACASMPRAESISALAAVLASISGKDRAVIEFQLRLAAGMCAVRRKLGAAYGKRLAWRVDDLFNGARCVAEVTYELLLLPDSPAIAHVGVTDDLLLDGSRAPFAFGLAKMIAARARLRPDVGHDLVALTTPGGRDERARYWLQRFGSVPLMKEAVPQIIGVPPKYERMWNHLAENLPWTEAKLAAFDRDLSEQFPYAVRITSPLIKAGNRREAARSAGSLADYEEAVRHARVAVEAQPLDPSGHVQLGAYLGQRMLEGHPELEEEAIQECEIAAQLDPRASAPLTEIGIIRFNARRFTEADAAFSRAEPFAEDRSHHFYARGINFMAMREYGRARDYLKRALQIEPALTWAKEMLVPVLMKFGKRREAAKLANETTLGGGLDTHTEWQRFLDPFEVLAARGARRQS